MKGVNGLQRHLVLVIYIWSRDTWALAGGLGLADMIHQRATTGEGTEALNVTCRWSKGPWAAAVEETQR